VKHSRIFLALGIAFLLQSYFAFAGKKQPASKPVLRWQEGAPGCSLEHGADGKYRYHLQRGNFLVTLTVDAQELEKSRRTLRHILSLGIAARLTGPGTLSLNPDGAFLEVVRHQHVRFGSLNPDTLSTSLQDDAEELIRQNEKEIQKHPEKKEELESRLREHQKLVTEWQAFIAGKSLRAVTLDSGTREVSGWVFFNSRNKWVGDWKSREDFVLRFPTDQAVLEFPFTLPPAGDIPELRQRNR
jgi:hypothetical protein